MTQTNPANRDPLSDAPGAHPVGTGIGAAGGAVTGAAFGAMGGPAGAAVGAVAGAVVGGLAGKGAAEAVNPTVEDAYWRDAYQHEPYYVAGRSYEEYRPAYELGWSAAARPDADFDAFESEWERQWTSRRGTSHLEWDQARPAARAAWDRAARRDVADATVAAAYTGDIDNGDVADVLNDLLESCRDGEYGFRTSAENADAADLKTLFMRHSSECAAAARELEAEIRKLGQEPASGGTVAGALHRGWVSVKTALTSQDDKAVLEECERGEDAAVAQYRKALRQPLPPAIRAVVERQAQGAQRNHDEVRDLRNRYRAAP
ncbi:Domain of uncharacterised function (DUF2383) [Delftia tsuruhatensis]|uniref:ferritin-like domain-containing protein n=1 Tax=Delftia tsuruhatensis TaxID=180282 RepID=UPI001E79486C|nr:PA2169 family four-helix-bundle protein [Delftia tsuruhatensis]CAB5691491.1 Domain of uncharacterised function (DUF2383) [Delftia tsuruhatensis]CAC9676878.1 Domain of uncharacterised function (DUF2383) [Delftia tsuruhatensis]